MAYISESTPPIYPEGVYQIEDGDPATGGVTGTFVTPSRALAERTKYLKAHVDTLTAEKAPLASPALTGIPTAPTAATGTNSTQIATCALVAASGTAALATADPLMDEAVAVGTSTKLAREDHRHPTDTTRAPLASPALTGIPTAPTAATGTNSTQIATCAFVDSALAGGAIAYATETSAGKVELATAAETATGTDTTRAVHPAGLAPLLALRAPLASPALTGVPTAPTAAVGTNTTQISTCAGTIAEIANQFTATGRRSMTENGYQKLPGGLIMQWGGMDVGIGKTTISFPVAFPSACLVAMTTDWAADGVGFNNQAVNAMSASYFVVRTSSAAGTDQMLWFAIGY